MQEQVRVIEWQLMSGSRMVKSALAAFRYLVTGIVGVALALLLVLLIVVIGAVIGTALEYDALVSDRGGSVMCASPQAKPFFFEGTQHAEDQFQ